MRSPIAGPSVKPRVERDCLRTSHGRSGQAENGEEAKIVQWLSLTVWVLVGALALPLSRGAAYGRVSLAAQALAAVASLALTIAVCAGGSPQLGWWALGCGGVGILAMGVASAGLTAEHATIAAVRVESLEEHEATLAGAQLLLFALATILAMLVGLEIGLAG
jgi:hypothetical protein